MAGYSDIDRMEREERSKANKAEHAALQEVKAGIYSLDPASLAHARSELHALSKQRGLKTMGIEAMVVLLAVMQSPTATVQDKVRASQLAAQMAGLLRDKVDITVAMAVFEVRGFAKQARKIIDASPSTAMPSVTPSIPPSDGATGTPPGGVGEG